MLQPANIVLERGQQGLVPGAMLPETHGFLHQLVVRARRCPHAQSPAIGKSWPDCACRDMHSPPEHDVTNGIRCTKLPCD